MKDILGLMALSLPLVLLVLIVLAMLVAVPLAIRYAKKRGRSKWGWGLGVFLLIFLPIFWNWIPTVLMHKYYCSTEAGFWVYKTVDQWKAENPNVLESLVANKGALSSRQGNMVNYTDTYFLNQRINKTIKQQFVFSWLPVNRREQTVVDTKTNQVLARHVDFGSYDRDWDGLKFWLGIQGCADRENNYGNFILFKRQLQGVEK